MSELSLDGPSNPATEYLDSFHNRNSKAQAESALAQFFRVSLQSKFPGEEAVLEETDCRTLAQIYFEEFPSLSLDETKDDYERDPVKRDALRIAHEKNWRKFADWCKEKEFTRSYLHYRIGWVKTMFKYHGMPFDPNVVYSFSRTLPRVEARQSISEGATYEEVQNATLNTTDAVSKEVIPSKEQLRDLIELMPFEAGTWIAD